MNYDLLRIIIIVLISIVIFLCGLVLPILMIIDDYRYRKEQKSKKKERNLII